MKAVLPKLKNNVAHLGEDASISVLCGGKTLYRNQSLNEYVFILASQLVPKAFERLSIIYNPWQIIPHFFEWDYIIDRFRDNKAYDKTLNRYKEWGLNKICMMDFSVFYSDPEERQLKNMETNFERAIYAQEKGFEIIFNYNNILDIEYNDCFPENLGTMIIDDNHSETKWFYRENIALRKLLQITKIEDVIFLSGKKTLQHRSGMLKILKDQGVMIHVIPSQWEAIGLWQKQKKDTRNAEALQH